MGRSYRRELESGAIEVSAPCRVDLGGTLDISTFYLPLRGLSPSTFNMAINMRTRVRLLPYSDGLVKVSSRGFKSAEFPAGRLVFDHPLGLMFAVAAYFGVDGVHVEINSSSPPRSALGGSSVAATALVAAFLKLTGRMETGRLPGKDAAAVAHAIESSVLGIPCGIQDQLAAAFGGINSWQWTGNVCGNPYVKKEVVAPEGYREIEKRFLVAYCGVPHESRDINGRWVKQFLKGMHREKWEEIVRCCNGFSSALEQRDYSAAAALMNRESEIRTEMTPDVFDETGTLLRDAALENNCGARFTGAGGGGCLWALGEARDISRLKPLWQEITAKTENGRVLDVRIDGEGLKLERCVG